MTVRIIYTLILALSLSLVASVRGADGDKPKAPAGPAAQAKLLLQHADDLGLTAEQKAKLEDFSKGPMSVLTAEQKTKAREFMPARAAAAKKKPDAPEDVAKKTDAEKKPDEEKKTDIEKKPDDVKKEDTKKEDK